jgi:hypothetical protein
MPIHGLIHDGQLRACPCALLGLMYGLKWLYVIRYLRFQFVGGCIKGQGLPFSFSFLKFLCQESFFHNQIGFLDAHGGHCMATVYIHYMFFFLCNSIYMRISSQPPLMHCIYMCVCISFWLISLYLWLALVFLFNKVYYRFTPLQHYTSQHYTSQHVFAFLISFRLYVVRWVVFVVKYYQMYQSIWSCTLQCIIYKELNGDHPFTYEEAFTHE